MCDATIFRAILATLRLATGQTTMASSPVGKSSPILRLTTQCSHIISFYDQGMVALLGNNSLVTVSSYTEPRPKLLATTPEGEIHSWGIISPDHTLSRSVEVLLSIEKTVYVVDATDCEDRFLDIGPFTHISISPDGRFVNLYAENGKAHVISSDFQERLFEHDSDSQTPPLYVEWCGSDAIIAWEDEVHIIGPGDISSSYIYDSNRVHVISGKSKDLITRQYVLIRDRI